MRELLFLLQGKLHARFECGTVINAALMLAWHLPRIDLTVKRDSRKLNSLRVARRQTSEVVLDVCLSMNNNIAVVVVAVDRSVLLLV